MAKTTGDVIVEKLIAWGVDTAFGMPGDGINGIFESLRKNREKIRFIQCRHEEAAAFAACGYAKFTGRLGVCFATSGPGAIHLLNGLYDAKLDHAPVLAITGHTYHDLIGTHFQQEIDILPLFKDVAAYNQMILGAEARARAGRPRLPLGPVDAERRAPDHARRTSRTGRCRTRARRCRWSRATPRPSWRPPIVVPQAETLKAAAELLNAGKKVVILAGAGGLGAADELERLADVAGRADHQAAAGQGRACPTTRPSRPAASACWARGPPSWRWRSATRSADRRHELPLPQVVSQARPGQGRADRHRPDAARPALPGRRRPGRRRQGHAPGAPAAAQARSRTARSWRRPRQA